MSRRRKDKKLKSIKRKSVWPRVLGMIFTDAILLGCTFYVSYVAVVGQLNTAIINNINDCDKVIKVVNDEWQGEKGPAFEEKIKTCIEYLPTIDEVYLVNPDFEILAAFGESNPKFSEIFPKNKKDEFEKGEMILRSNLYTDNQEDLVIGIDSRIAVEEYTNSITKALSIENFANNLQLLNVNKRPYLSVKNWSLLKTNNPELYVCFNSNFTLTQFHSKYFGFLLVIFVLVFVFCVVYEIVRLISYILGTRKYDDFISTDMTTGGYNKDGFVEVAQKKIKRNKTTYAVVKIRMEKYRNYCTAYGLKEGETLLEEIGIRLEYRVSKKEVAAHIEKSDFALLLEYSDEKQLEKRVYEIIDSLTTLKSGQHLCFVASIKKVESKTDDVNELLTDAALALRVVEGKTSGIAWYNDSMKEEQLWERRIEDDMESALENHEFQLYLQPKYSTKKETLAAAEALVRWIHPELGFISPGKFIPLFERNGFILKLDDYMLNAVAQRQAKWMAQGRQLVPISVNVSRAHFTREDLAEHICGIVDQYKVPHQYIELELTESAFFDDKAVLLSTVNKLKEYGFSVSMDDFGAGYSSLNSLKELPLDVIKLDAQFFREINDVQRANLIVGDTISLAKKLGMQIVAEGIETREQVDFLAKQDCDLIQGFYFAKPLTVLDFEKRAYPN